MTDAKNLHIDDDWKSQAAAEKERLASETEPRPEIGPLPPADLRGLVSLVAMQAMVGLGGVAGPDGRALPPNLDLAKHYIDLLDVLEQKCRGNVTLDEKKMLDTTLHQLRMAYVEAISAGLPPHSDR